MLFLFPFRSEKTTVTLSDNINSLTEQHPTIVHIEEEVTVVNQPALLETLREAVFGGMERTGGSGMKASLPISEGALDLYQLIDHQIAEAWSARFNRVPSADKPEALLIEWAHGIDPDEPVTVTRPEQGERDGKAYVIHVRTEYTPDALAERWVQQITDFFNPTRTAEITAPCFVCDTRWVHRKRDGQTVQTSALVFRRERDTGETTGAECLACGTQWTPPQFLYLAKGIGAKPTEATE